MRNLSIGTGALVGALLAAPMLGILYLGRHLLELPFVPYDLFDWSTRVLPGAVVTFGIDLMIDVMRLVGMSVADSAKTAEKVVAVLGFFVGGVVASIAFFAVFKYRHSRPDIVAGLIAGALAGLPIVAVSVAITGSTVHPILIVLWLLGLFLAWGVVVREAYIRLNPEEAEVEAAEPAGAQVIDRRQFLIRVGAATATITVASTALGSLLANAARRELEEELEASMAHISQGTEKSPFPNADDPVVPAPGTRPEYTPLKDHYKVFIRTEPTIIDGATWTLPIMGFVDNPMTLTIDDIRNNYESYDQYVTLSCISGRIASTLISTTQWTGVSLQDILADVKPQSNAGYLYITSGDGFYETVALDLIASDERIMLCHSWDGNPIPMDHGFPLRIWLPDRYGMKQPKWITGIEVTEEERQGYWVERGWSAVAQIQSTSVIDTVAADAVYEQDGQQLVPVGGIAWAGDRQISKVELRVDEGPWQEAQLRSPLSETTWVIWRYDWPFMAGNHKFEVRCQEGDGTPQIEKSRGNRPNGATGTHKKTVAL